MCVQIFKTHKTQALVKVPNLLLNWKITTGLTRIISDEVRVGCVRLGLSWLTYFEVMF